MFHQIRCTLCHGCLAYVPHAALPKLDTQLYCHTCVEAMTLVGIGIGHTGYTAYHTNEFEKHDVEAITQRMNASVRILYIRRLLTFWRCWPNLRNTPKPTATLPLDWQ